jgi:threonylcarbamoyladenosine tRNA methylthiotransferase MtaB
VSGVLKTLTLGCKVNQYETQLVREGLHGIGFRDADSGEPADLCLVNTCTVTQEGDAKSRQAIRRMHRQNPHAQIVVMGCYATRAPQEIRALPGVSEVILDKRELPDWLGRHGVIDVPRGVHRLQDRSRAYVKVQDGCLLRCSYCIIPQVRPHMYSRPLHDIVDEVRSIREVGVREIVLTGIHLGHYGVDWNAGRPKNQWTRLPQLIRALLQIQGEFRIRLSSIEATEISRELIAVMRDHSDRICPHLHVCVQSGSDDVLRRMRRRWGAKRLVDRCRLVRDSLPDAALTTDVIVGFPGETDADFEQTMDVCRTLQFSKVHIFPFSPRRGTDAAEMPDQIPSSVKAERCAALARLEVELRREYFQRLVGRQLRVLLESVEGKRGRGTSCRYAPVEIFGDQLAVGSLRDTLVTGVGEDCLIGKAV